MSVWLEQCVVFEENLQVRLQAAETKLVYPGEGSPEKDCCW